MLSSKEIQALTGISDRTIRDWQSKGIIPKSESLQVVISAIVVHLKKQVEEAKNKETKEDELYLEKVRLTRAQADKVELEIAEREGELVDGRETVLAWSSYILACRSRLLGMPTKLAHELAGVTVPTLVEQILKEAVDEALEELGDVEGLGITSGDSESVQATTEAENQ